MTDLPLDLQRIIYGHKYRIESMDDGVKDILDSWKRADDTFEPEDEFLCVVCWTVHEDRQESLDLRRGREFCRVCQGCCEKLPIAPANKPEDESMWCLAECELVDGFDDFLLSPH
jgi:hypothetical protein